MEIEIIPAFIEEIGSEISNLCSVIGPSNVNIDTIYESNIIDPEYWHDQMIAELTGPEIKTVLETVGSTKYHGSNIPGNAFVQVMTMELQDSDPKFWNSITSSPFLNKLHRACTKGNP